VHRDYFGIAVSLVMSAIGLWLGFWLVRSPRSYLAACVKYPPPKWLEPFTPKLDPESRTTQWVFRILGVGVIAFVTVYLYAMTYDLGLVKVRIP
jgi:hypothetical protein